MMKLRRLGETVRRVWKGWLKPFKEREGLARVCAVVLVLTPIVLFAVLVVNG